MKAWKAAARAARAAEQSTSSSEAVDWWMLMFSLWDTVPNEFMIVHPRIVWDRLYVRCSHYACPIPVPAAPDLY
eukprot:3766859-Pleurochrysis_carterae.AAC.1